MNAEYVRAAFALASPCQAGAWTTTAGDHWTAGFWAGMHWLAAKHTGEKNYRAHAAALAQGLKNWITVDTFKSFPLYFGAALGCARR
ncbi:MAG TPA: hypothetical protein VFD98_08845 [Terracidiphilus sp.]|jgi:unsaturated chondroitin disaccharide hydrolase|nr:hypothetical protein [Terracidiphilus sp.]